MDENKSKISNVEWGLVIGALFFIDIIQILLEWILGIFIIGEFIIWVIDLFVGMSFGFYLHMRGESMTDPKRAFGLMGTFLLELVPGVSELPLWSLDGLYAMSLSKSKRVIEKMTATEKPSEDVAA